MKLHQIWILGDKEDNYPEGLSHKDFNLSTAPFFQFIIKGLGRGKAFFNIKKLTIELSTSSDNFGILSNVQVDKGYISTIKEGGFDFHEYFKKNPIDRIIMLSEVTKKALNRVQPNTEQTSALLIMIDKIIEMAPKKEAEINKYIEEFNKIMKNE